MTPTNPDTSKISRPLWALIFSAACGVAACAPDDGEGTPYPPYTPIADGGTISMPNPIVMNDAGTQPAQTNPVSVATNDAGTSRPLDSGTPTTTVDAGAVGATVDSGSAVPEGGTSAEGGTGSTRPDKGMGDGKDVITIGDSWMNLDDSVGIQQSLEKASKRDYRNFGVPGTKLLDEVIPKQYTTAKMQGPVKTVIMTAGGNDVLQDPILLLTACPDDGFTADCKTRIDEVAARLQKLWAQMAADGVEDVLIVSYSNKTLGGGYKMVSAYSTEKITPLCSAVPAPLRCSSFDTDMSVMFMDRGDSIHPDNATYDAIGAGVWKLMQDKGMRR